MSAAIHISACQGCGAVWVPLSPMFFNGAGWLDACARCARSFDSGGPATAFPATALTPAIIARTLGEARA